MVSLFYSKQAFWNETKNKMTIFPPTLKSQVRGLYPGEDMAILFYWFVPKPLAALYRNFVAFLRIFNKNA